MTVFTPPPLWNVSMLVDPRATFIVVGPTTTTLTPDGTMAALPGKIAGCTHVRARVGFNVTGELKGGSKPVHTPPLGKKRSGAMCVL